ncbi:MAG: HU family DNA-binding protein [Paramuribaculum sp.]|nr:HU family DNA-binding protein [Paramuribaculum sp.]
MNQKISLKQLAEKIAAETDVTTEYAEEFIKDFFSEVSEQLSDGVPVEISGLGKFTCSHDSSEPVIFSADTEFAAQINQPFALFAPEIITDDIDESEINKIDEESSQYTFVDEFIENNVSPVGQESISVTELSLEIPTMTDESISADSKTSLSEPDNESVSSEKNETTELLVTDIDNARNTETEFIPDITEIECLPEDKEEIIEYTVVKSNFGVGLFTGLFLGLALSAIAFTIYILYWTD